jgi:bifunctional DNA-binding transcriptional regulator/antitoxin component of YhaV-PrlF toxin-antitoxin module
VQHCGRKLYRPWLKSYERTKVAMPNREFRFTGEIERVPGATGLSHIVGFPEDAVALFGSKGPVRVVIELMGGSYNRSLVPRGDGTHYFYIPPKLRQAKGMKEGDKLDVTLRLDTEPPQLEMCDELAAALAQDDEALAVFESISPSNRRGMNAYIADAKHEETRIKRAVMFLQRLQSGHYAKKPKA